MNRGQPHCSKAISLAELQRGVFKWTCQEYWGYGCNEYQW